MKATFKVETINGTVVFRTPIEEQAVEGAKMMARETNESVFVTRILGTKERTNKYTPSGEEIQLWRR